MLKYRNSKLIRVGILGTLFAVLIVAVGLRPQSLVAWATSVVYQAEFEDAGGLTAGNDVVIAGTRVGEVRDVALGDHGATVTLVVKGTVRLGSQTTAHIRTGSLLGARLLTIEPKGPDRLRGHSLIPLSRTGSPYSLNESVNELTTNVASTDTATLNQSLDTLSSTLDQIAPQLGPTLDGLTRLSQSLTGRSDTLRSLLRNAADVTAVLSDRSEQLNTLILNGNDLLAILVERRDAIARLLASTAVVAHNLTGLVHDNEAALAPALEHLNSVTEMLEKNRDNIAKAVPGLRKYLTTSSEAVANGPYYTAYVPNLIPSQFLQPFLDYAFGFRAGDPNMPRALFPAPRNGIPEGPR
ncbi:MCE family protein [Mycobacterium syngnathidarum]